MLFRSPSEDPSEAEDEDEDMDEDEDEDVDEDDDESESTVEIKADIQAVNRENGTLVLFGMTVRLNTQTVVEDDRDEEMPGFGIDDLMVGDRVEVIATSADSNIIATQIIRKEASSDVSLEGPVSSFADPTLQILSVGAVTTAETDFENADSAAEFFGQLAIGTIMKVKGTLTSVNVILTDEAELEN